MKIKPGKPMPAVGIRFRQVPAEFAVYITSMINVGGEPYAHHGQLQHFMPVDFGGNEVSQMLWAPGCETLAQHAACSLALAQHEGLPMRGSLIEQVMEAGDHSMTGAMSRTVGPPSPLARSTDNTRPRVTGREVEWVDEMLARIEAQVKERRSQLSHATDPFIRVSQMEIGALLSEAQK